MKKWVLAVAVLVGLVGCHDGTTFTPYTGTLQVVTATLGDTPDPDGYELLVDSSSYGPVAPSDTVEVLLDVAEYEVGLAAIDAPCVVVGDHPGTVEILPEERTVLSFELQCPSP